MTLNQRKGKTLVKKPKGVFFHKCLVKASRHACFKCK